MQRIIIVEGKEQLIEETASLNIQKQTLQTENNVLGEQLAEITMELDLWKEKLRVGNVIFIFCLS